MGQVSYKDIAKAIRQIKPPVKRLTVDVVLHPDYLSLRVCEDEVMEYEINQRADIMKYLLMLREMVNSYGVRCEIEGAASAKRRR